ncbi:F-box/LRR-repeat protein [Apostasia shenzhenica]|uniref:F-box/LRR-repeat protein n=1 Tax=Apostasia shenzhenica TaxID=1088818 RepID=A0A2I0A689_9ASPA|nr:F-box/LRR-repeat protein [Apostasia shenzhenica]
MEYHVSERNIGALEPRSTHHISLELHENSDSTRMAEIKSASRRWEDMETDVLVKIFKELNMIELAPVALVCHAWRSACSDPLLWNTLDLGLLKSNFIQTRASPYIWVDDRSDRKLMKVLRIGMSLSRGTVACLVFHFNLYMKDEHLSYIAERCPHLKRLVMPAWNRITKSGICQAIQRWEELESLTMPSIANPSYIMEEISRSCKNFSHLKVMGTFDMNFASAIATNLPKLRVLSIRCSILTREALVFILDCMDQLEVLNISHCLLLDSLMATGKKKVSRELDSEIRSKVARLREFLHCQSGSCFACERITRDEGLMRWYKYEEWFWRQDEVGSLTLGDYGKLFDEACLDLGFRI